QIRRWKGSRRPGRAPPDPRTGPRERSGGRRTSPLILPGPPRTTQCRQSTGGGAPDPPPERGGWRMGTPCAILRTGVGRESRTIQGIPPRATIGRIEPDGDLETASRPTIGLVDDRASCYDPSPPVGGDRGMASETPDRAGRPAGGTIGLARPRRSRNDQPTD